MACNQVLNGIASDCGINVGGIKEVYIANYGDVTAVVTSGGQITSITMSGSTKFKVYKFKKNTGSMNSTTNISLENGTNYTQTDLSLSFNRQETAKRIEMNALSHGELAVIVKDCNDVYTYLGLDEFVSASSATAETGQNRGDKCGYSITLTDYSKELPHTILIGTGGVDLSEIVDF